MPPDSKSRLINVTGMPGLFEVVSSKADGAIVRSLEDKSTKFISSRVHNLSHLESIEIYTVRDNVQLSDVFAAMKASSTSLPDVKDNKALKAYFENVYPDLDFERVYASDMKKMIKWFEIINANNIDFTVKAEEEPSEEEEATTAAVVEEPVTAEPPFKKASKPRAKKEAPAKTAEASEATAAGTEEAEKPKRGRKKKTEE